jgi:hypothetical protein
MGIVVRARTMKGERKRDLTTAIQRYRERRTADARHWFIFGRLSDFHWACCGTTGPGAGRDCGARPEHCPAWQAAEAAGRLFDARYARING